MAKKLTARQKAWNGGKWITPCRRLGIYLRDGLACTWCGHAVEDGVQLSLDHLRPHSKGGGNESTNLVTACSRCNSSRGDRPVAAFARAVAEYLNHPGQAEEIVRRIRASARRRVPVEEAKVMLERRGGITAAIDSQIDS